MQVLIKTLVLLLKMRKLIPRVELDKIKIKINGKPLQSLFICCFIHTVAKVYNKIQSRDIKS